MNKVSVSVFLPALSKNYDIVLPVGMKIGMAIKLMADVISEQESISIKVDSLTLSMKERKDVLDDDTTLYNAGVKDGSILILV